DALQGEIAINPLNPDILLVATWNGRCWLSRDAGASFAVCSGPQGRLLGFHFTGAAPGRRVFAATEKGIWRSDDGGQTWTEKDRGLPWIEIQGFAGGDGDSAAMLYCTVRSKVENGSFKGGVYRSRDGGENWEAAMGNGLNTETSKAD